MSDAEAFERAIIESPEERATYSAYADWLQEHDDPRGEFIAVQLALEDESRPKKERAALAKREQALLAAHEREWLGELAPLLLDRDESLDYPPNPEYRWGRGFLSALKLDYLTVASAQTLASAPVARFLRELRVGRDARDYAMDEGGPPPRVPTPAGAHGHHELFELIGAPCLRNLRVFQMGDEEPPEDGSCSCHTYAEGLEHVVATMPRVEELHLICKSYDSTALFQLPNLTNLRVLRIYALGEPYRDSGDYEIRLDRLAENPALGNLTHLSVHPHFAFNRTFLPHWCVSPLFTSPHLKKLTHLQIRLSDMGDDGIRAIIDSGILKRLEWLDLRYGAVTDAGARLLAACPDAKRLERIDLSSNGVTAAGLAAMRKAKLNAVANAPLTEAELDSGEYLRHGDFE